MTKGAVQAVEHLLPSEASHYEALATTVQILA